MKIKVYLNNNDRTFNVDYLNSDYPVIFEIEEEPDFDHPLYFHNGRYYTIRCWNIKEQYMVVRAIDVDETAEEKVTEYDEETVRCPVCGFEVMDAWELDDYGEYECPDCGATIEFERNVTITYSNTLKAKGVPNKV